MAVCLASLGAVGRVEAVGKSDGARCAHGLGTTLPWIFPGSDPSLGLEELKCRGRDAVSGAGTAIDTTQSEARTARSREVRKGKVVD